jgi:hypothetical protein
MKVSQPCELNALLLEKGGEGTGHECLAGRIFPLLTQYIQYPNPAPRITTTAIATPTPIATAESIFGGLISRTTVGNKEAMTLFAVLQLKKSLSGRDRGLARL